MAQNRAERASLEAKLAQTADQEEKERLSAEIAVLDTKYHDREM